MIGVVKVQTEKPAGYGRLALADLDFFRQRVRRYPR
jgi:hypothetical protein